MPKNDSAKAKAQHKAFKEAALDLSTDESEANFDKALRKLGKALPPPKPKKRG